VVKPPKILVIKSDTSELIKVEEFLKETFEYYHLAKDNFRRVYLCLSEAVINSIEHGNENDKNKDVTIEVQCDESELNFMVKDEGEGFDVEDIDDPTKVNNIKKESGRGIHIIRAYCDKIEFKRNKSFIRFKMDCQ
jgi:serine/threonine-protein kinase RsbW